MEKNKLKKLAGVKEAKIVNVEGNLVFEDERIIETLESIKKVLTNNDTQIKEVFVRSLKNVVEKFEKPIEQKVDFNKTNSIIKTGFSKLETPFVWLKDYLNKIIDLISNFKFPEPDKPIKLRIIKTDGKATEIISSYRDKVVTNKINRTAGEVTFTRNERRNNY